MEKQLRQEISRLRAVIKAHEKREVVLLKSLNKIKQKIRDANG